MWKRIECVAIYTEDTQESVQFYQSLVLSKAWETYQNQEKQWRLSRYEIS
ncbi:hypothetical protein SAMN05421676_105180 [Salinibacillus kushneri]|uniref:Glyoxalase/Bleomycin resistance protein/Dioxygenase superfamily protein n=1 Tax=Salinibacillus kushneri TaxID=237682 RepID=A0A1I0F2W8_9BACI|nr:hypothetical protein SAMN05421676_105180 [Salinibacillus kushneri]